MKLMSVFGFVFLILLVLIVSGCTTPTQSDDTQKDVPDGAGCCTPLCKQTTSDDCDQVSTGGWRAGSCSEVNECKVGCCIPVCEQTTKVFCEQVADEWRIGSCEQQPECETVCCDPFDVDMTKVECEQRGGTPKGKTCQPQSMEGSVVVEVKSLSSCRYRENNIVERLTFIADKDSLNPQEGTISGTATYDISGNSVEMKGDKIDTKNFGESGTADATLTFKKYGDEYSFVLGVDIPMLEYTRTFQKPGYSDTYKEPYTEGAVVEYTQFGGELKDKWDNSQQEGPYIIYGFSCESEKADVKVTWDLSWVSS